MLAKFQNILKDLWGQIFGIITYFEQNKGISLLDHVLCEYKTKMLRKLSSNPCWRTPEYSTTQGHQNELTVQFSSHWATIKINPERCQSELYSSCQTGCSTVEKKTKWWISRSWMSMLLKEPVNTYRPDLGAVLGPRDLIYRSGGELKWVISSAGRNQFKALSIDGWDGGFLSVGPLDSKARCQIVEKRLRRIQKTIQGSSNRSSEEDDYIESNRQKRHKWFKVKTM